MKNVTDNIDLEGVTFVGGEPLHQTKSLLKLVKRLQRFGLSIMLYTGYELDEIYRDPMKHKLFKLCDIVVSGRYIEELRSLFLRWRGSTNQIITVNNPKYNYIKSEDDGINELEIHVNEKGEIKIVGFPDEKCLEELLEDEFIIREAP